MTVKDEKIVYRLRGVAAILHAIGEVPGQLADLEFALLLLTEQLDACVEELERD